jgi:hypothetical protein
MVDNNRPTKNLKFLQARSVFLAGQVRTDFQCCLNIDAIVYMQANKLPQSFLELIIANLDNIFADDRQWTDFLAQQGILPPEDMRK